MIRAWLLIGSLLTLVAVPRVALADGLRNVERATSGERTTRSQSASGSSSAGSAHSSGSSYGSTSWSSSRSSSAGGPAYDAERCQSDPAYCGSGSSLGLLLMEFTVGAPWSIPRVFFDERALERYAPYPFADGPGVLRPPADPLGEQARKFAIALDAESGYMLQGVVPAGLALRLMMPYRLELDARFSGLSDVTEHPVAVGSAGTTHLTYRFAQGKRYDFRTGLGLRAFQFDSLHLGFDLLYGVDVYIGPRVVWRVELHVGSAGHAFAGQARTTLGVMLARFELYAGYDHTAYLSCASDAALGGPIAGLRAWF